MQNNNIYSSKSNWNKADIRCLMSIRNAYYYKTYCYNSEHNSKAKSSNRAHIFCSVLNINQGKDVQQFNHNQRHNHNRPFFPSNSVRLNFGFCVQWRLCCPFCLRILLWKICNIVEFLFIKHSNRWDHWLLSLHRASYCHLFCVQKFVALFNSNIYRELMSHRLLA